MMTMKTMVGALAVQSAAGMASNTSSIPNTTSITVGAANTISIPPRQSAFAKRAEKPITTSRCAAIATRMTKCRRITRHAVIGGIPGGNSPPRAATVGQRSCPLNPRALSGLTKKDRRATRGPSFLRRWLQITGRLSSDGINSNSNRTPPHPSPLASKRSLALPRRGKGTLTRLSIPRPVIPDATPTRHSGCDAAIFIAAALIRNLGHRIKSRCLRSCICGAPPTTLRRVQDDGFGWFPMHTYRE